MVEGSGWLPFPAFFFFLFLFLRVIICSVGVIGIVVRLAGSEDKEEVVERAVLVEKHSLLVLEGVSLTRDKRVLEVLGS